jgi:hypothetical protein
MNDSVAVVKFAVVPAGTDVAHGVEVGAPVCVTAALVGVVTENSMAEAISRTKMIAVEFVLLFIFHFSFKFLKKMFLLKHPSLLSSSELSPYKLYNLNWKVATGDKHF